MRALMISHIDRFSRTSDPQKRALGDCIGVARKGDHRAVRVGALIHAQHADISTRNRLDDRIDDPLVTTLAEVRYTFDQVRHPSILF